jgi:RimJ/RimL family protein N-acetyltransferase
MSKTHIPQIVLEPLRLRHASAMHGWMRDPDIRDNVGVRAEPTLERTRAFLRRAGRDKSVRGYAVLCRGRHVGNVILDRIDSHVGTARLSIYVGEASARGRGIGRAAVSAALAVAFDGLRLNKVWLVVHVENRAALRTYRAAGFVREGRLRQEFVLRDRVIDVLYMGLLRRDWRG